MPLCEKFFIDTFLKEPYNIRLFIQNGDLLHTGILVNDNGTAKQIHLAWHQKLCCDMPPKDNLYVIDFPFFKKSPALRQSMVQNIVDIYETNQNTIPYATKYKDTYFALSAKKPNWGHGEIGLTCATFILAAFHEMIRLVDVTTWENREEDEIWRQEIIGMMERLHVPQEHIDKVVNEKGNIRVRPEEVFVASDKAMPDAPCEFVFCASEGLKVRQMLQKM
jgi:hypothetical protein